MCQPGGLKVQPVTVDLCFEQPLSASSEKACHSDGRILPPSILIRTCFNLFHSIPLISSESSHLVSPEMQWRNGASSQEESRTPQIPHERPRAVKVQKDFGIPRLSSSDSSALHCLFCLFGVACDFVW